MQVPKFQNRNYNSSLGVDQSLDAASSVVKDALSPLSLQKGTTRRLQVKTSSIKRRNAVLSVEKRVAKQMAQYQKSLINTTIMAAKEIHET